LRRTLPLLAIVVTAAIATGCGRAIQPSDVSSDPIAFIRQEPKQGISSVTDFVDAMQLLNRPIEELGEKREKMLELTVALLTVPTGEIRRVPDAKSGNFPLDWSRDGRRLLVGRFSRRPPGLRLYSWNRLSGAWDRIEPGLSEGSASLGDGVIRVGFVGRFRQSGAVSPRAVLVYTRTEGVAQLPGAEGGDDPDVSPDGESVVFVRPSPRVGRQPTIMLWELGAEEARPIGRGAHPKFSRNGEWIAYESSRNGNADVWIMRSNGTGKRQISRSSFDEEFPALSPDGRHVVYASVRGGDDEDSQLYLARTADAVEIQLTRNGQNSRPVW
jgi:hypothetical protein